MRPDQERVRNLLIDTVTLLCKNSLQFKDELHVEGLLGVSVDKKDVFFVHISKEFTNSPSDGATVTQIDNQSDETQQSHGSIERESDKNAENSQQTEHDEIKVKTEAIDDTGDECSIVEDPNIKLEGIASPAHMVAGQRRSFKRTSHGNVSGTSGAHDQYSDDNSNLSVGYIGEGGLDSSQYLGEPPVKRRNNSQDSYVEEDQGQQWPSLSGISGFDPSQLSQTFQETDNGLLGTDSSQPGCSSWSTPGRGPSDSINWRRNSSHKAHQRTGGMLPRTTFTCDFCGKIFNHKVNFEVHVRSHTGERPFRCPQCPKSFSSKGNMQSHARKHHPRGADNKPALHSPDFLGTTQYIQSEDHLSS